MYKVLLVSLIIGWLIYAFAGKPQQAVEPQQYVAVQLQEGLPKAFAGKPQQCIAVQL